MRSPVVKRRVAQRSPSRAQRRSRGLANRVPVEGASSGWTDAHVRDQPEQQQQQQEVVLLVRMLAGLLLTWREVVRALARRRRASSSNAAHTDSDDESASSSSTISTTSSNGSSSSPSEDDEGQRRRTGARDDRALASVPAKRFNRLYSDIIFDDIVRLDTPREGCRRALGGPLAAYGPSVRPHESLSDSAHGNNGTAAPPSHYRRGEAALFFHAPTTDSWRSGTYCGIGNESSSGPRSRGAPPPAYGGGLLYFSAEPAATLTAAEAAQSDRPRWAAPTQSSLAHLPLHVFWAAPKPRRLAKGQTARRHARSPATLPVSPPVSGAAAAGTVAVGGPRAADAAPRETREKEEMSVDAITARVATGVDVSVVPWRQFLPSLRWLEKMDLATSALTLTPTAALGGEGKQPFSSRQAQPPRRLAQKQRIHHRTTTSSSSSSIQGRDEVESDDDDGRAGPGPITVLPPRTLEEMVRAAEDAVAGMYALHGVVRRAAPPRTADAKQARRNARTTDTAQMTPRTHGRCQHPSMRSSSRSAASTDSSSLVEVSPVTVRHGTADGSAHERREDGVPLRCSATASARSGSTATAATHTASVSALTVSTASRSAARVPTARSAKAKEPSSAAAEKPGTERAPSTPSAVRVLQQQLRALTEEGAANEEMFYTEARRLWWFTQSLLALNEEESSARIATVHAYYAATMRIVEALVESAMDPSAPPPPPLRARDETESAGRPCRSCTAARSTPSPLLSPPPPPRAEGGPFSPSHSTGSVDRPEWCDVLSPETPEDSPRASSACPSVQSSYFIAAAHSAVSASAAASLRSYTSAASARRHAVPAAVQTMHGAQRTLHHALTAAADIKRLAHSSPIRATSRAGERAAVSVRSPVRRGVRSPSRTHSPSFSDGPYASRESSPRAAGLLSPQATPPAAAARSRLAVPVDQAAISPGTPPTRSSPRPTVVMLSPSIVDDAPHARADVEEPLSSSAGRREVSPLSPDDLRAHTSALLPHAGSDENGRGHLGGYDGLSQRHGQVFDPPHAASKAHARGFDSEDGSAGRDVRGGADGPRHPRGGHARTAVPSLTPMSPPDHWQPSAPFTAAALPRVPSPPSRPRLPTPTENHASPLSTSPSPQQQRQQTLRPNDERLPRVLDATQSPLSVAAAAAAGGAVNATEINATSAGSSPAYSPAFLASFHELNDGCGSSSAQGQPGGSPFDGTDSSQLLMTLPTMPSPQPQQQHQQPMASWSTSASPEPPFACFEDAHGVVASPRVALPVSPASTLSTPPPLLPPEKALSVRPAAQKSAVPPMTGKDKEEGRTAEDRPSAAAQGPTHASPAPAMHLADPGAVSPATTVQQPQRPQQQQVAAAAPRGLPLRKGSRVGSTAAAATSAAAAASLQAESAPVVRGPSPASASLLPKSTSNDGSHDNSSSSNKNSSVMAAAEARSPPKKVSITVPFSSASSTSSSSSCRISPQPPGSPSGAAPGTSTASAVDAVRGSVGLSAARQAVEVQRREHAEAPPSFVCDAVVEELPAFDDDVEEISSFHNSSRSRSRCSAPSQPLEPPMHEPKSLHDTYPSPTHSSPLRAANTTAVNEEFSPPPRLP